MGRLAFYYGTEAGEMRIVIEIHGENNAAYDGDDCNRELLQDIHCAISKILHPDDVRWSTSIHDLNGNTVGTATLEQE